MALLNDDEQEALRVLAHPGFTGLAVADLAGMTALHHAARGCYLQVVEQLRVREPSLAQVFTLASRTPGHWSALHCVSDAPPAGENQALIVRSHPSTVVQYSAVAPIMTQRMTFTPSLVSGIVGRGSYGAGLGFRVGCSVSAGCTLALRARCVNGP